MIHHSISMMYRLHTVVSVVGLLWGSVFVICTWLDTEKRTLYIVPYMVRFCNLPTSPLYSLHVNADGTLVRLIWCIGTVPMVLHFSTKYVNVGVFCPYFKS